jgi:hypothetical protein
MEEREWKGLMGLKASNGALVGLGLGSQALYLATVLRLPWWRYGGTVTSWSQVLGGDWRGLAGCLLGIGVLMLAYVWGWTIVRRGQIARTIVWGFAGLFAVTLFWLVPITSDLFTYLSQAHLFTDLGLSPLEVAPLASGGDRVMQAYPAAYAFHPSVYGPAWTLISLPGTLGPYDVVGGLIYLKGLAVMAYLGCAWLLVKILGQSQPEVSGDASAAHSARPSAVEGLYFFAWNPLVLLMAIGDGHNDIVMMALVLLALWLLLRQRWALAFGALTLSAWIKYITAIFIPFFLIHAFTARLTHQSGEEVVKNWTSLAGGMLMVAGITLLVFAPFWGPGMLNGIIERVLHPASWQSGDSGLSVNMLQIGLFLFAIAYLVLTWRFFRSGGMFEQLVSIGFDVSLLAFVLGAARSQPWHLIWPATLASLSERRWALPTVTILSAVMLSVQAWVEWGAPGAGSLF